MNDLATRRDILRYLLAGVTAPLLPNGVLSTLPAVAAASDGLQMWSTFGEQRHAQSPTLKWSKGLSSLPLLIKIEPSNQYQEILGFGAAFTDAACFTLNRMESKHRADLLNEFFNPKELNLSMCRTCIGSSDYSTEAFSYDEGDADPDLKRFSLDHDRKYVLPMLLEARKVNPELFLFSSPWSPPGWMKSNKSMLGGNMQRKYMVSYANYFAKFLRGYAEAGVPIQAVTIQNEVDTDQDGKMPACAWPQEYEADFAGQILGPTLEKEGLKTKIWVIDHNYNLWGRAICELESPAVRKYVDGIAWHGYLGSPEAMTKVHDAFPSVNTYWTEGGPEYTAKNYTNDFVDWGKTFVGILRNWSKSITAWNLVLDEVGKPNIGPFFCGGFVTVANKTDELTRSGQYWAMAHLSKSIMRGAKRIGSESTKQVDDLHHVAFENTDGVQVLIVVNSGTSEKQLSVQLGDKHADLNVSPLSVTTIKWNKTA